MQKVSFIYCPIMMLGIATLRRQAPKMDVRYCDISQGKGALLPLIKKFVSISAAQDKMAKFADVLSRHSSTKFSLYQAVKLS